MEGLRDVDEETELGVGGAEEGARGDGGDGDEEMTSRGGVERGLSGVEEDELGVEDEIEEAGAGDDGRYGLEGTRDELENDRTTGREEAKGDGGDGEKDGVEETKGEMGDGRA